MKNLVRAADGRKITVLEAGHPSGHPVFLLHGTPGSRLGPFPRGRVLYELGVRLISFDRPGYGGSDRLASRLVADVVPDVRTIADELGVDRFAVVGRSGGSPHALACAALLPERVTRAAVLVSLAPWAAEGLDWFAGMADSNVREYLAAANEPEALTAHLVQAAARIKANPAGHVSALSPEMPEEDRKVLADGAIRALLAETFAEALRDSAAGWIDDALAFCSPWGFNLADIKVPVLLWHGQNDAFSPVSHARWLADQIPGAIMTLRPDNAHFGSLELLPDVLSWLIRGEQEQHLARSGRESASLGGKPEHGQAGQPFGPDPAFTGPDAPDGDGGGGSRGGGRGDVPAAGGLPIPARRFLKGRCPGSIRIGEPFSLLVSVVVDEPGNPALRAFPMGLDGRDILLVVHAPGLRVLGSQRQAVHVPFLGNSDPVMFELLADAPGLRQVNITAWLGGTYLGQLDVETTSDRYRASGPHRDVFAEIGSESVEGAVSLVVRYDPGQNAYRFEFRDEDNPEEVTSALACEPGRRVEQLVSELDRLAEGRTGYSVSETRHYLVNAGASLWRDLIPERLREQFWERQHRIKQLTILTDSDTVPWELLYPLDPGHDAGFLVEQFPVTRTVFGRRLARSLSLHPARFVLPDGSPSRAREEVDTLRSLLSAEYAQEPVISALTPLLDLIRNGNFGLLHFACHNRFDPADGSSIALDNRQFTPLLLTTAAISQELTPAAPTVFINACRSAGANVSYHRLDGWARKFIEAGAGAFIGSQWAVRDSTARDFASELYTQLRTGAPLGHAVMRARQAAASEPGDPTWLAYAVYGDSRATLRQPGLELSQNAACAAPTGPDRTTGWHRTPIWPGRSCRTAAGHPLRRPR
jgi:pimeloyl-ACP methyl ester carboxylesterase